MLRQKFAVFHHQLIITALDLARAHIPQPACSVVIFRQNGFQFSAKGHPFLYFTEQMLALFFQQLLIQRCGLHHQAQAPALEKKRM